MLSGDEGEGASDESDPTDSDEETIDKDSLPNIVASSKFQVSADRCILGFNFDIFPSPFLSLPPSPSPCPFLLPSSFLSLTLSLSPLLSQRLRHLHYFMWILANGKENCDATAPTEGLEEDGGEDIAMKEESSDIILSETNFPWAKVVSKLPVCSKGEGWIRFNDIHHYMPLSLWLILIKIYKGNSVSIVSCDSLRWSCDYHVIYTVEAAACQVQTLLGRHGVEEQVAPRCAKETEEENRSWQVRP